MFYCIFCIHIKKYLFEFNKSLACMWRGLTTHSFNLTNLFRNSSFNFIVIKFRSIKENETTLKQIYFKANYRIIVLKGIHFQNPIIHLIFFGCRSVYLCIHFFQRIYLSVVRLLVTAGVILIYFHWYF